MTGPVSPAAKGTHQPEQQSDLRVNGSSGAFDPERIRHKAQLIRIACDIAAVAKRYRRVHDVLFGFSVRKALHTLRPDKRTDFAALEIELDSIEAESKRIQDTIGDTGFCDPPKRAKTTKAICDSLNEYSKALTDAALKLNLICRSLRRESENAVGFTDYSTGQFRQDRAAYDASVQQYRRWGARLTELFDKF